MILIFKISYLTLIWSRLKQSSLLYHLTLVINAGSWQTSVWSPCILPQHQPHHCTGHQQRHGCNRSMSSSSSSLLVTCSLDLSRIINVNCWKFSFHSAPVWYVQLCSSVRWECSSILADSAVLTLTRTVMSSARQTISNNKSQPSIVSLSSESSRSR